MRSLAFGIVLACVTGAAAARPTQLGAPLHQFFAEEWEWELREFPESATLLGDRRYDDRLTDLSLEAITRRKAHLDERLARARRFVGTKLGEQDRLSLELFIALAERDVALARFPTERLAVTQHGGPHRDLPSLAIVPRFDTIARLRAYVARLRAIPRYVEQTQALLEEGRRTGWMGAREPLRDLVTHVRSIRDEAPERSVFFSPFKDTAALPDKEVAPLLAEARAAITEQINPAFLRLADYLERTYLPAARKDPGAWSLPDGATYYQASVRAHTTTARSPYEIHELGLREVARIRGEMDRVIRATGFAGTRTAWNEHLRTEPRFFYKDPRDLLIGYRDIAKRIDHGLPRLFGRLPRLPYGVIETPAFEAPTSTTAYYRQGSSEDGRAGAFVANTYKPETRPKWEMEALTLHEAVPGHHLQIAIAQELEDLPRFRREASITAFIEGWGLYAESLGPALGLFTEAQSKYGQLTYEMWRAVRLVVDTGLHAKRWTRQQAIDFFAENAAKTRHDIEVEVDRYIVWPGQALAYKTGELEIKRLRALAEQTLGPRFDVRRFHDAVLGAGPLPLDILDRRIRAFIDAETRRR